MTTNTATNSFGLRNQKSSTAVGLPCHRSLQPLVHAVRVRGGDSADEAIAELVSKEFLSKENLTTFFAVNGLLMGAGFEFASNLAMKLMHNYNDKDTPANHASRLAGAHMCAYGLISYLSVMKNVSPTKAMGWSLVPLVAHIFVRDILESSKSRFYQKAAATVSLIIAICAASLITDQGPAPTAVAAGTVLILIGSIDVLSILLPDKMMQVLEYTTDFQPNDYKLRFVTQAVGVHSLCHLAQFFALWQGKDPITSVGYSAITTAILGLLVCVIGPNLRKSGAPLAPIFPFIGLYAFMSWKIL